MIIERKGEILNCRVRILNKWTVSSILGSYMKEDIFCSKETKTRIAIVKEALYRKRKFLCGPMNKDARSRLAKYYVGSVTMYAGETWT